MIKKHFKLILLFSLPPVLLFLFILGGSVGAVGPFWGRAEFVGYFSGEHGSNYCQRYSCSGDPAGTNFTLPRLGNSLAVPYTQVGNCGGSNISCADRFVSFLQAANASGDRRRLASSGFIVNILLGRSAPGSGSRSVSAADWTDLRLRLEFAQQQGLINWQAAITGSYESYSEAVSGGNADVAWASTTHKTDAITIYNPAANDYFVLYRTCANIRAGSISLPPASNFDLTPTTSVNPTIGESGGAATVTSTVTNGGTTASSNVNWQVTTFTLNPSDTIPAAGTSNSSVSPQAYYGHGATKASSGTGVFQKNVTSPNPIPDLNTTIGDYPVGTKLCYALSVQPYNGTTTDWRHGLPSCITIAKRPKVQVLGGDLIVGQTAASNIVANPTVKVVNGVSETFGSWGEYGVVASGTVTGFASGAGYAGGQTSSAFCDVSLLTFTNAGTGPSCSASAPKGGYSNVTVLPDISSRLIARTSLGNNPTVNVGSTATGAYSATGNVTVNGGTIGAGKWVVINAPTATVTIKGNIIYDPAATLHTVADIPQVVIIANNINIDAGVGQVDAWLIATGATGNLNTCSQVTDPTIPGQLNAGTCNQVLTVNGPVIARHLFLYRTAGAGTGAASGDPAEVFNLRPDAYLWATSYLTNSGRLQTVTTKELPPRF
jgi:hypothetical protein